MISISSLRPFAVAVILTSAFASSPACAEQTTAPLNQGITETTRPATKPYQVHVEGSGPPMILIPGLMCDDTVWDDTVAHYRDRYQCHVFSLAGFAGVAPVDGPFVPTMRDALVSYIRDNKLEKPIIIGHSLGGHLAYVIAMEAPQNVGPIIAVDGAPAVGVLLNSDDTSTSTIATRAGIMRSMMLLMPQDALAEQAKTIMASFVTDQATAARLAKIAGNSHTQTVANAMYELSVSDLREDIASIQSPVLLIGAAQFATDDSTRKVVRSRYEKQVEKIPNHKVVMTYDARHFIMLDQPEFFYKTVDEFLQNHVDQ